MAELTSVQAPRAWTPPQQAAIEHVGGDVIVSAAAGSGKTAVLAERCVRLVTTPGPDRSSIDRLLVVTFTEAAAHEMRSRIAETLHREITLQTAQNGGAENRRHITALWRQAALIERASISTLHAFCARMLRINFQDAGVDPAFEILDEDEAGLLRDEMAAEVLARWHSLPDSDPRVPGFASFFEAYAQGRNDAVVSLIHKLHAMLASLKDPDAYLAAARAAYTDQAPETVEAYVRTVSRRLRLLKVRAQRGMAPLRAEKSCVPLAASLAEYVALLDDVIDALEAAPRAGFDTAAQTMRNFVWTKPRMPNGDQTFKQLREMHVNKVIEEHGKLAAETFAAGITAETMIADLRKLADPLETLLALTRDFGEKYAAAKQSENRLDFSDLERFALALLQKTDSPAVVEMRQRYDHLLVDEAQDINPLQAALLEALRNAASFDGRGNLFMVGDVKQSIYGFRLADPQLFLDRLSAAARVTTHQASLTLPHNFRSLPGLLGALNEIFLRLLTPAVAGVDYAAGHALQPPPRPAVDPAPPEGGVLFTGTPIELHVAFTDEDPDQNEAASGSNPRSSKSESKSTFRSETASDAGDSSDAEDDAGESATETLTTIEREANLVADRMLELHQAPRHVRERSGRCRPLAWRDMAVLLRSVKNRAEVFARVLEARGIPVYAELSTGYFDAAEVRDTLSLLRVLDNPQQDIALAGAMVSPYGGFSFEDLARIRLHGGDRRATPFYEAVRQMAALDAAGREALPDVERALAQRLAAFFDLLERYRNRIRSAPLHEALAEIYQDAGMRTYVAGLSGGRQRSANLQALYQRACQFAGFRRQGLYRFLRLIEKLQKSTHDFGQAPVLSAADDVVRIMSIHKSKGLEFPVVFMSGLGGKFNIEAGGPVTVHRTCHIGLQTADELHNVFVPSAASLQIEAATGLTTRAEELRLLYVALTRAREHLILTGTMKCKSFAALRALWRGHQGPLPEDVLCSAGCFFDFLLPLLADPAVRKQVELIEHPLTAAAEPPVASEAATDALLAQVLTGKPLANPPADMPPVIGALLARLSRHYPLEPLTTAQALLTVTELKQAAAPGSEEDQPSELGVFPAVCRAPDWTSPEAGLDAKERGSVVHRVLETLDLSRPHDAATVDKHIEALQRRGQLSPEQAALINSADVAWFFTTPLAARVNRVARGAGKLFRELPFVLRLAAADMLPAEMAELASRCTTDDIALLRGTIDLLLIEPDGATIIDYKTDRALSAERQNEYQRQVGYYARAVREILRVPVRETCLVLLATRQVIPVETSEAS